MMICGEVLAGITLLWALSLLLGGLFWRGTHILAHDNLYWNYPAFHFFAESLANGSFPLWNPFAHGGEPFYPALVQLGLLDPSAFCVIFFGRIFTDDTVLLFNWLRFLQCAWTAAWAYAVLRPLLPLLWQRISLLFILNASSFFFCSFTQDGAIHGFLWAPAITWAFLKVLETRGESWPPFLLFASFLGLEFQSYFFAPPMLWLLFFVAGILLFARTSLLALFRASQITSKFLAVLVILVAMAAPNVSLWSEKGRFVFPSRMAPPDYKTRAPNGAPVPFEAPPAWETPGILMDYDLVRYSGGATQPWDLIQAIAPEGNGNLTFFRNPWGNPSECYLYIGLLGWALAWLGIFLGRHPMKRAWGFALALMVLTCLGPATYFHRALFTVAFPLWFIRNMGLLIPFVAFALVYFVCLGLNALVEWKQATISRGRAALAIVVVAGHAGFVAAHHPEPLVFAGGVFLLIILPIILFIGVKNDTLSTAAIVLAISGDLIFTLNRLPTVSQGELSPAKTLGVSTRIQALHPPGRRAIAPEYPIRNFIAAPRYLELLQRKPYVFSATKPSLGNAPIPGESPFDFVRSNRRWNSFLLLRGYHETVYSSVPSAVLEKAFLVGSSPLAWISPGGAQVEIPLTLVDYRSHNDFSFAWDAGGNGAIYRAEGYDPNWKAIVDARPVAISPANSMFQQIPLTAGKHVVELRYRPWPFLISLGLFYLGVFGAWVAAVIWPLREFSLRNSLWARVTAGATSRQPA